VQQQFCASTAQAPRHSPQGIQHRVLRRLLRRAVMQGPAAA
jgi:hypothetical protein